MNPRVACPWPDPEDVPDWQWLRETPVAIVEENELPMWGDPQQIVDALREMGASLARYPAIGWGAHFYGESEFLPKYPFLDADQDLFGDVTRAMRRNEIRVMAYCHYGVLYPEFDKTHPHWLSRDAGGDPIPWGGGGHRTVCLFHGDFVRCMRGAIGEVVDKYSPDVVYLDGPGWYCDCYCDDCRAAYEERYGEPMPDALNFEDLSRQRRNRLRDEKVAEVVAGVREEIHSRSGVPLLFNTAMGWYPTHSAGRPELTALHAEGANTTEVHRPGSIWGMLESVKLGESLKKVSLCYLPPGPYDTLRTHDTLEVPALGAAYLMHGGTPMLQPTSSYFADNTGGRTMREFLARTGPNAEIYYRSRPVKELGLAYSLLTGDCASRGDASAVRDPFSGAFRALLHGHRHFDCLLDSQISAARLAGYRAIYLPQAATLDERQAEALREFVAQGGALIASGPFSLVDEEGKRRENFLLADVLGVDYEGGRPDAPYRKREYRETGPRHGFSLIPEAYLRLTEPDRLGLGHRKRGFLIPVADAAVGVPGLQRHIEYVRVRPRPGVEALADMYLPAGGAFGEPLDFPLGFPPGVTLNRFGKGRALYCAASLEVTYLSRRIPDLRRIIVGLVDLALDGRPVLRLDASPGVMANVTERHDTTYVHLLNYCGPMFESGAPVEELTPQSDIRIHCRFPGDDARVRTLYGGETLEARMEDGYAAVTLPTLAVHEVVIFEPAG